jgi:hypothetical protein
MGLVEMEEEEEEATLHIIRVSRHQMISIFAKHNFLTKLRPRAIQRKMEWLAFAGRG